MAKLLPKSAIPTPKRTFPDEDLNDKENRNIVPPVKKLKIETTTLKDTRGVLLDRRINNHTGTVGISVVPEGLVINNSNTGAIKKIARTSCVNARTSCINTKTHPLKVPDEAKENLCPCVKKAETKNAKNFAWEILLDRKNGYTKTTENHIIRQSLLTSNKTGAIKRARTSCTDTKTIFSEVVDDENKENKNISVTVKKVETSKVGVLHDRENGCITKINTVPQGLSTTNDTAAVKENLYVVPCLLSPRSQILQRRSLRFNIQHTWGQISPIAANKFAPLAVVINQGIPEGHQKLGKKTTLHRSSGFQHQGTHGYFDDFYDLELLEDVVCILLRVEYRDIIKTTLERFNACILSRSAVVNWLIQAQEYLDLPYQEIFTVVYLFDLVISSTKIAKNMYQLVGLTILWIVSKNDDIVNSQMAPRMLALCKGVYTKQQFLKMEKKLLLFFDFRLNMSDVTVFVGFYIRQLNIENHSSRILLNCVLYVLECYMLNPMYSTKLPSLKAAAAISLVLNILYPRLKAYDALKNCMGDYRMEEIQGLTNEMLMQVQSIQDPRYSYRQPYIKYSSAKNSQASLIILQNLVAS